MNKNPNANPGLFSKTLNTGVKETNGKSAVGRSSQGEQLIRNRQKLQNYLNAFNEVVNHEP